ncbi:unnamed protein product [Bursaphelenchus okinawaensis]|uniref:Receptor ligand binding region domain-containing protein n=1 Tax=Bursaphelenchus okinawaensis TaxID=465554 RepID=A0A811JTC3_9BILA|nr:unnamed protein product [Bursaphelenchus okinawaensis]CAG9081572.1 unnamed protein product [Bursaphelenchus okinawaensis]
MYFPVVGGFCRPCLLLLLFFYIVRPVDPQLYTTRSLVRAGRTWPFDVLVVLPEKESENDKFGLTIDKARPVIEIAVEDVVRMGIQPQNWVKLDYKDSRFWEDPTLAERHAATAVINAHCAGRLDAVIGFADEYSLATVAKISAGFNKGIPIITTTGLNSALGAKKSFPFLSRIQGSYQQMADSIYQLIAYHGVDANSTSLNYKNFVFMYHDKRRAVNRMIIANGDANEETPSSHCYFTVYAIKMFFMENSPYFKQSWKTQASHVAFDEGIPHSKTDIKEWLKLAANASNGKKWHTNSLA